MLFRYMMILQLLVVASVVAAQDAAMTMSGSAAATTGQSTIPTGHSGTSTRLYNTSTATGFWEFTTLITPASAEDTCWCTCYLRGNNGYASTVTMNIIFRGGAAATETLFTSVFDVTSTWHYYSFRVPVRLTDRTSVAFKIAHPVSAAYDLLIFDVGVALYPEESPASPATLQDVKDSVNALLTPLNVISDAQAGMRFLLTAVAYAAAWLAGATSWRLFMLAKSSRKAW